jgi:cytochrome P450
MADAARSNLRRAKPTRILRIDRFEVARELLRSDGVRQAGFKAELVERFSGQVHAPVLFQEGEQHQRQRSATARFFAPRVVAKRYRDLMDQISEKLVERFRVAGRARLDDMSTPVPDCIGSFWPASTIC